MDDLINELQLRDRERWFSALWAPHAARPAVLAIFAYDLEQQRVVADAREPMLSEIRLAWWREQLENLAAGQQAPAQPILRALAEHALPRGVDFTDLTSIEEGYLPLLTEGALDPSQMAAARGKPLFRTLARAIFGRELSDSERQSAESAGERWALSQLWRHGWGQAEDRLSTLTPPALPEAPKRDIPATLLALDALAVDDWKRMEAGKELANRGSAGRQWRMMLAALRGK